MKHNTFFGVTLFSVHRTIQQDLPRQQSSIIIMEPLKIHWCPLISSPKYLKIKLHSHVSSIQLVQTPFIHVDLLFSGFLGRFGPYVCKYFTQSFAYLFKINIKTQKRNTIPQGIILPARKAV